MGSTLEQARREHGADPVAVSCAHIAVAQARPELGVVYTPREVCEPMVRQLLAPMLASGRDPRTIPVWLQLTVWHRRANDHARLAIES